MGRKNCLPNFGSAVFKSFRFYNCEHAGDVEAEVDVAVAPIAGSWPYEIAFGDACGVGEDELENVATGFYVNAEAEAVGGAIKLVELVKIFAVKGEAIGEF